MFSGSAVRREASKFEVFEVVWNTSIFASRDGTRIPLNNPLAEYCVLRKFDVMHWLIRIGGIVVALELEVTKSGVSPR